MAEERDPLTETEKRRLTPDGMSPAAAGYVSSEGTPTAASGTYTAGSKDPAEIQRDIAHTRAEMSETVDAIGARFEPEYLKEQAKDVVRSTARDAKSTMMDTIKENPVPSILAGLSLGWLIAKGATSDHERDRRDYEEHYFRIYGRYPDYRRAYVDLRTQGYPAADSYRDYGDRAGQMAGRAANQMEDLTDQARQKAQGAADQAGHLADKAEQQAGHLADRATDMAQEAGHQVEYYGRQATSWLQGQVDRNPLGVGAAALAAGALVGMSVPETRAENRLIGEQAERAKAQARSAAQEKLEQAKNVASRVADEAADSAESVAQKAKSEAKDVADTARSEAKKEGLDVPPKVATGSSGSSSSGATSNSMSGGSTSGNSMSGTSGSSSGGSTSTSKTAGTTASGSGSTSR